MSYKCVRSQLCSQPGGYWERVNRVCRGITRIRGESVIINRRRKQRKLLQFQRSSPQMSCEVSSNPSRSRHRKHTHLIVVGSRGSVSRNNATSSSASGRSEGTPRRCHLSTSSAPVTRVHSLRSRHRLYLRASRALTITAAIGIEKEFYATGERSIFKWKTQKIPGGL